MSCQSISSVVTSIKFFLSVLSLKKCKIMVNLQNQFSYLFLLFRGMLESVAYNRDELLFRKLSFWVCLKMRRVTKRDALVLATLRYMDQPLTIISLVGYFICIKFWISAFYDLSIGSTETKYRKVASNNASRFVTRLVHKHTQNDNFLIRSPS